MTTTAVKTRPVLFSGEMVRAILDRSKSQTRRVVKPQPHLDTEEFVFLGDGDWTPVATVDPWFSDYSDLLDPGYIKACEHEELDDAGREIVRNGTEDPYVFVTMGDPFRCPYSVGMRLWVRETWQPHRDKGSDDWFVRYRADQSIREVKPSIAEWYSVTDDRESREVDRWRPSIFMPRWASRLTLEVTGVRIERLQDISEEDAQAEGVELSEVVRGSRCWHASRRAAFRELWDRINGKTHPWDSNPWVAAVSFTPIEARTSGES